MNVWSTSGPVPVDEAPEPGQGSAHRHIEDKVRDIDVVVDQRREHAGRAKPAPGPK